MGEVIRALAAGDPLERPLLGRRALLRRAGLVAAAPMGFALLAGCDSNGAAAVVPTSAPSISPTLPTSTDEPTPAPAGNERVEQLQGVRRWVYQLQNVNPPDLAAGGFDLAVTDYATNDGEPWSVEEVGIMQSRKLLVLAYLSIGEAESYRPYWDPGWDAEGDGLPDPAAPGWLLEQNPDWEGNYRVRYWDPDWQAIVLDYLDSIVAAGFDGAYLDIVDAYEMWEERERAGAAAEMAGFVEKLADHARARVPGFLIFPQNAPGILGALDPATASSYLAAVDGIGAEDSFYYGDEEEDNPYEPQTETIGYLDRFVEAGKLVLAVDYLTEPGKVSRFYEEARAREYIPYAGVRSLDRTVPQPDS